MTIFGVGMALARNPYVVEAIQQAHYDVVSHGQRWLHYQHIDIDTERQHMDQAISVLKHFLGKHRSVGTQVVTVPIPANYWLNFLKFNMTVTTTVMICLFGQNLKML